MNALPASVLVLLTTLEYRPLSYRKHKQQQAPNQALQMLMGHMLACPDQAKQGLIGSLLCLTHVEGLMHHTHA